MSFFRVFVFVAVLLLWGGRAESYNGGYDAGSAKLDSSTAVLNEIMATSDRSIPADLLRRAQGIAVIPGFLKAGFIFGADYGRGVLVRRNPDGSWSDPSFIRLGGGNFGFQIGVESTDLVLVFTTARSLDVMTHGKLLLGGTASVAVGPVGRTAMAETSPTFSTEVFSYSRSRGAFAGVALDGAYLTLDCDADRNFYGASYPQVAQEPASARRFTCTVASYSGSPCV
jgi:lipid-binding SYLF domain-containing protein